MKKLTMFVLEDCPYCKQAFAIQEQLCRQEPRYREIEIQVIEEEQHKDIAAQYDYYYVPCYFIGKQKLFEGVPTPKIIRNVLETALQ